MTSLPTDTFDLGRGEADERFRWARAQGRPAFPWPGVSPDRWRSCLCGMESVVRTQLSTDAAPSTLVLPMDVSAETASVAAFTSGLGALLGLWVEEGRLRVPGALAGLFALHLLHGRRRAEILRAALADAVACVRSAGFPVTVLKGLHTGAAYFPEPGVRPAADVDLLLPAGTLAAAGRALEAAGYRRGATQRDPDKADWIPPGTADEPRSLHLAHAEDPVAIELHGSLAQDFFGVRTVTVSAAEVPSPALHPQVTVLAPAELVAYLALHTSRELHRLQLLKLVELALVLRTERARGRLMDGSVADVLRRAGGLRFALPALHLTDALVPGVVEPTLLERARRDAPARMLRYLADLRPHMVQRLEGVALDERFIWSSGPLEWGRRAVSLVWPNRAYGSARPPLRTLGERLVGLARGRVRMRASGASDGAAP